MKLTLIGTIAAVVVGAVAYFFASVADVEALKDKEREK